MKFMVLVFHFLVFNLQKGWCLKWTTPVNRAVYGENGKSLSIKWAIDFGPDEKFFSAEWSIGLSQADLRKVVVVLKSGEILPSNEVESATFGEVTIKQLDPANIMMIKAVVSTEALNKITDIVTIKYLGAPPSIVENTMQLAYDVLENSNSSKNIEMLVKAQGDPTPNVYWLLNGQDVSTMPGFTVVESNQTVNGLEQVVSNLQIQQLTSQHNGQLQVMAKLGQLIDEGPSASNTSTIDVKYSPKDISFTHNVTSGIMHESGYIKFVCKADGNPTPHYVFKEGSDVIYNGINNSHVVYVGSFYHKRQLNYICIANNTFGHITSNVATIKVENGTLLAKKVADENSDWWIYFGVAVSIGLLIFLGFSAILFIMRRRMRSLNLRQDIDKVRARQDHERRTTQRTNGASHVYDINERARQGTATQMPQIDQSKKRPQLGYENVDNANNWRINDGFDISVYDTVGSN